MSLLLTQNQNVLSISTNLISSIQHPVSFYPVSGFQTNFGIINSVQNFQL